MKRIIIHGMRLEDISFVMVVKGWHVQPSLVEFEDLLANQEAMAKKMGDIMLKSEEEALYMSKNWRNFKPPTKEGYEIIDKGKRWQGTSQPCRSQKTENKISRWRRFEVTSKKEIEDEWDAKELCVIEENELKLMEMIGECVNYESNWIIDSRCSTHMTGDHKKLQDMKGYKGSHMVLISNNAQLLINEVGNTKIMPSNKLEMVSLHNVYHVLGMKKKLLLVSQLTSSVNYVLFGPQDVQVY
ncbi:hypothetical protein Lser_V15G19263 [Lactuca serriola]